MWCLVCHESYFELKKERGPKRQTHRQILQRPKMKRIQVKQNSKGPDHLRWELFEPHYSGPIILMPRCSNHSSLTFTGSHISPIQHNLLWQLKPISVTDDMGWHRQVHFRKPWRKGRLATQPRRQTAWALCKMGLFPTICFKCKHVGKLYYVINFIVCLSQAKRVSERIPQEILDKQAGWFSSERRWC